jgi:phage tail-like protein
MGNGRLIYTLGSDWRNTRMLNLTVSGQNVVFTAQEAQQYGTFATGVLITRSIDSNEQNYSWGNMQIDATIPENSVIRVYCYASDSKLVSLDEVPVDLDGYIMNHEDEGKQLIKEHFRDISYLFHMAFSGALDGLVNQKGRYLWIKIELLVPNPSEFLLRNIRLVFPNEKLIQYLPQIYRDIREDNDFFVRFMDIFESVFFDIEREVEEIPKKLDYTVATGEMLRYLASWICLDTGGIPIRHLPDTEIRKRMFSAVSEYKEIGTRNGVLHYTERELGVKPIIVEYFMVKKMVKEGRDKEVYRELFGENPYCFFLLIPEEAFSDDRDLGSFIRALRNNIPAQTEAKVVLLKKRIVLDKHTYLGINSVIGNYNYVSVDQNISISYDTLIGGNPDEKQ